MRSNIRTSRRQLSNRARSLSSLPGAPKGDKHLPLSCFRVMDGYALVLLLLEVLDCLVLLLERRVRREYVRGVQLEGQGMFPSRANAPFRMGNDRRGVPPHVLQRRNVCATSRATPNMQ